VNPIHLVILWHMHQPQYRNPATGQYLLPWTRLHALKDYWGMAKILAEFPEVHATFNFVPLLAEQIEEYAGGKFREEWFEIVAAPADALTYEQKRKALERAFQVHENLMSRWPRFLQLQSQLRSGGPEACAGYFTARDWRDLQVLSQLAWMDEEYLSSDPAVRELSEKGAGFTEEDKAVLLEKQHELLSAVLPEYRRAAARGQIEISATPYYHPILPLLCDTDIARVSNPHTPLPVPAFRYPRDAREQLTRGRALHERVFGKPPVGLWPSEGSVSEEALGIAMELDFEWFATDEGVLGRTQNIGFWRDAAGFPENGEQLYTPWRLKRGNREMSGFFRDHYLSDLVGFVYSRMAAQTAAEDLHRRIRAIGDRTASSRTPTISLILDGENAWEYYPGNGREFLRQFYRLISRDPTIRALTASEAAHAAKDQPDIAKIFPASWIGANFDVWIGDAEDIRSWELLRDAREAYQRAVERHEMGTSEPSQEWESRRLRAYESILAAEGSDWNWWYGPEHGSANDAEFDALYRTHLTEIYRALGEPVPEMLARPIKHAPERACREAPMAFVEVRVDGRESNYFEWLGAGLYATDRRQSAMHGRSYVLGDLHYGFGPRHFYLRVDPIPEVVAELPSYQIRLTIWDSRETRITLHIDNGKLQGPVLEQAGLCLLHPEAVLCAAYEKIFEIGLARELFDLRGRRELLLSVALWKGGLPLDVLPSSGMLNVTLGEEHFAWPPG